jgi:hypothetical protein
MVKLQAEVALEFESYDDAKRVLITVAPDNTPLPSGLAINSYVKDNTVIFEVSCERSLESMMSTIEDIMSAVDLSLRTTRYFNHKNGR